MRAFLPVALLVFGLAATAALAEDSEYEPPEFGGEDVILEQESAPEGWTVAEGPNPAQVAMAAAATAQAKAVGIEGEDDFLATGVSLKTAAGAEAAIVLVDLEVDPKGMPAAMKAEAEKNGWLYRELGSPGRILLADAADGPEAAANVKAVVDAQVAHAVDTLVKKAGSKLQLNPPNARFAKDIADAALAIEPKSGGAWAIKGFAAATELRLADSKDKAKWKEAAGLFEKAFAADAVMPPTERFAALMYGEWGLALLSQKDAEANRAAKGVLQKAIGLEEFVKGTNPQWIHRYNLVCAQSLLGEKAEAIQGLEAILRLFMDIPGGGKEAVQRFLNEQVAGDEDLAPIRSEPAFAEMVKKFA